MKVDDILLEIMYNETGTTNIDYTLFLTGVFCLIHCTHCSYIEELVACGLAESSVSLLSTIMAGGSNSLSADPRAASTLEERLVTVLWTMCSAGNKDCHLALV